MILSPPPQEEKSFAPTWAVGNWIEKDFILPDYATTAEITPDSFKMNFMGQMPIDSSSEAVQVNSSEYSNTLWTISLTYIIPAEDATDDNSAVNVLVQVTPNNEGLQIKYAIAFGEEQPSIEDAGELSLIENNN